MLKEYQSIQRSIIIDLQKLSDHNLLLSSDVKAAEYLQERYNHLKELHINLEQKMSHLRVCNFHRKTNDILFGIFRSVLTSPCQLMIKSMIIFNK